MRISLLLLLACGGSMVQAAETAPAPVIPVAFPTARYAQLRQKSPFSLATPDDTPKTAEKTFAEGWSIKGISRIPEDGKFTDIVSVKTADARESFTLESGKERTDGVTIASVDWSPELGKTTVTVKKGTEFAKLEFNQADMQSAPPVAAPVARPGQPGVPGGPQPFQNGSGVMGTAGRQFSNAPGNRINLPRPVPSPLLPGGKPGINGLPQNGAPGGVAPRRVRNIPSPK